MLDIFNIKISMPRASKRTISQTLIKKLSGELTDLISSLKSPEYISEFLDTFLTNEERIMVSKRLMLYILLEKSLTTTQITSILTISRQTVLTHKKNWTKSGNLYRVIMKKMIERRQTTKFWEKLEDVLYPLDLIIDSRSNMQARAKLYQGDFKRPRK